MSNRLIAVIVTGIVAANASAHFPFLVPDGPNKGKAVFSDTLKPDNLGVPVDKIAGAKLVILDGGKATDLTWAHDKTANCYTFEVAGSGSRIVIGTIDYGVLQRGDSKPFRLYYHPKGVFGEIPAPEKATAGDRVPLELTPIVEAGKLRFKAMVGGKPIGKAEVNVLVPGEEKTKVVATDDAGLTPTFDKPGTYGAYTRQVEVKTGEHDGKKYEEVRHYATLAVVFGK
jgi:hypothetical protein